VAGASCWSIRRRSPTATVTPSRRARSFPMLRGADLVLCGLRAESRSACGRARLGRRFASSPAATPSSCAPAAVLRAGRGGLPRRGRRERRDAALRALHRTHRAHGGSGRRAGPRSGSSGVRRISLRVLLHPRAQGPHGAVAARILAGNPNPHDLLPIEDGGLRAFRSPARRSGEGGPARRQEGCGLGGHGRALVPERGDHFLRQAAQAPRARSRPGRGGRRGRRRPRPAPSRSRPRDRRGRWTWAGERDSGPRPSQRSAGAAGEDPSSGRAPSRRRQERCAGPDPPQASSGKTTLQASAALSGDHQIPRQPELGPKMALKARNGTRARPPRQAERSSKDAIPAGTQRRPSGPQACASSSRRATQGRTLRTKSGPRAARGARTDRLPRLGWSVRTWKRVPPSSTGDGNGAERLRQADSAAVAERRAGHDGRRGRAGRRSGRRRRRRTSVDRASRPDDGSGILSGRSPDRRAFIP
jgi:hypothetical protein